MKGYIITKSEFPDHENYTQAVCKKTGELFTFALDEDGFEEYSYNKTVKSDAIYYDNKTLPKKRKKIFDEDNKTLPKKWKKIFDELVKYYKKVFCRHPHVLYDKLIVGKSYNGKVRDLLNLNDDINEFKFKFVVLGKDKMKSKQCCDYAVVFVVWDSNLAPKKYMNRIKKYSYTEIENLDYYDEWINKDKDFAEWCCEYVVDYYIDQFGKLRTTIGTEVGVNI